MNNKYKLIWKNKKELQQKIAKERTTGDLTQEQITQMVLSEAKFTLKPTLWTSIKRMFNG